MRIALRLKGLVAETVSLDLLKGDQFDATYTALNPEMVVPTLLDGDGPPLVQSLAIIEYLEEKYPQSPLMPVDLRARAHVRGLAQCWLWTRIPLSSRACENISNRSFISMNRPV